MGNLLREYETIFVLHPDLTEEVATQTIDRLREVITKMGGQMLNEEHWGKKKLAFPVKKQSRGNFLVFHFVAPVGTLQELERTFRNLDAVIRYLSSTFGSVRDVEARRAEVEKRAKERAAARAKQEAERQERDERMAREAAEGGGRDRDRDRDRDRGDRGDRGDRDRDRDRDRYDDAS